MKKYIVIIYDKASGIKETRTIEAESKDDARESLESSTIQVMKVVPMDVRERSEPKPDKPHRYESMRHLRARVEQRLCDKAMGIVRETRPSPEEQYETAFETRFIAQINGADNA